MDHKKWRLHTLCTHAGGIEDTQFRGVVSPLYMSTAYAFDGVNTKRYPRYFNTPNQEALAKKIAALEHGEAAMLFASGMAAESSTLLSFLQQGDHVVLQQSLYGGTFNMVVEEFTKFGIEYSFTDGLKPEDFKNKIRENTRVIYIETPSNPLLTITDIAEVVKIARKYGLVSVIDNTFASPVNQNPLDLGIDVVIHSATKYLGGHSDILAGAVVSSQQYMTRIQATAKNFGGSLSDYTVWLLERSIKTLGLRVKAQNRNAKKMAKYLYKHPDIFKVYYPGLKSHPDHALAKAQMRGYGGMLSFELRAGLDPMLFQRKLKLIKPVMSLAGVESTILSPAQTSHVLLKPEERIRQGISEGLLRFSLGIENIKDLIDDIEQALAKARKKEVKPSGKTIT